MQRRARWLFRRRRGLRSSLRQRYQDKRGTEGWSGYRENSQWCSGDRGHRHGGGVGHELGGRERVFRKPLLAHTLWEWI